MFTPTFAEYIHKAYGWRNVRPSVDVIMHGETVVHANVASSLWALALCEENTSHKKVMLVHTWIDVLTRAITQWNARNASRLIPIDGIAGDKLLAYIYGKAHFVHTTKLQEFVLDMYLQYFHHRHAADVHAMWRYGCQGLSVDDTFKTNIGRIATCVEGKLSYKPTHGAIMTVCSLATGMLVAAIPLRDTQSASKRVVLERILEHQCFDGAGEEGCKTTLFATDNPKADCSTFQQVAQSVHGNTAAVQMDVWHAVQRIMRHMHPDRRASWYAELDRDCKAVFYTSCYHCSSPTSNAGNWVHFPHMWQEYRAQHLRLSLRAFAFKWHDKLHAKARSAIDGLLRISTNLVAFAPYRGQLLRYGTTANEWSHLSLKRRFVRANYLRADHFRVWLCIQTLSINMQHKKFALSRLTSNHPLVALLNGAFLKVPIDFANCPAVPWILKKSFRKQYTFEDACHDDDVPMF
jgi:hypothetical protein